MPSPDVPAWKQKLEGPPLPVRGERTHLGLMFQLRTLTRDGSQWTAPRAETATSLRRRGTQRLAVRPATFSSTGRWVTSAVTWGSLSHKVERLALLPEQVQWFLQFQAVHRAGEFRAAEADWLYLDDFTSPLLWPLLADAQQLGIELLTGKSGGGVRIVEADVTLGIHRDGAGLRLEPQVLIGGDDVVPTGAVSDHGVYLCRFSGGLHVTLAQTTRGGSDLAAWGESVRVPADEVDEFWSDYYPPLTRRVPVVGHRMPLPEVTSTTALVLTHLAGDAISTCWELRLGTYVEPLLDPPFDVPARIDGSDALEFLTGRLPEIQAAGVLVDDVGERPEFREREDLPELRFVAVPVEGKNDWFDLGFAIVIGDYTIALADVVRALSKGRDKVQLVDKTWYKLDHPVYDLMRQLLDEGAELREWETGVLVPKYHADRFEPFEDHSASTPEALAWRAAASALTGAPEAVEPPAGLTAALRPYQLEGFRWLAHLWRHRLGGVLADDMGLGKTLQTIALIQHVAEQRDDDDAKRPFLVVAPTSVVGAWLDEVAKFAPGLQVVAVASTKDPIPPDADVVVTSYALFRLEFDRFERVDWTCLVLDEAQYVKNAEAQVHDCAYALRADLKIALTGTPLENGLMDLWAIFRVVAPGLFASRLKFANRYVKAHSAARIGELRRRIRPLMLRRTKANVALELPPKQEHVLTVDLDPQHRALYDRYLQRERQKVLDLVEDLDRNRFIVFRSLTLLRMLALDPALIDAAEPAGPGSVPSAKVSELLDRIDDLASEGHRALVFSQFTSYLAIVRERLDARGIAYEYLDGTTTRRPEVISRFRDGDAPVFLVSLRAGGVGLTLTEADYVFLLDPWWNPQTEAQAIDRTHRIGQDQPVMVYRMVARDTIEEKVLALSDRKRALFDEVIDGGDLFASALTADDVRSLLG